MTSVLQCLEMPWWDGKLSWSYRGSSTLPGGLHRRILTVPSAACVGASCSDGRRLLATHDEMVLARDQVPEPSICLFSRPHLDDVRHARYVFADVPEHRTGNSGLWPAGYSSTLTRPRMTVRKPIGLWELARGHGSRKAERRLRAASTWAGRRSSGVQISQIRRPACMLSW